MKKIFFFGLLAFIGFAPHVFAQGFTALAPIPGLTDAQSTTAVVNSGDLASFFNNLYKYLIGLAATLAVIEIIWAGLDIAYFHKDAVSAITNDKGRIYNAIFGLILVLSPVLVFSIINPSILNLSLNLPKLDTASAPNQSPSAGTGTQTSSVDTTTGCTVTGTMFQRASCPSQQAATDWAAKCTGFLGGKVSGCKLENASGCADTSYNAVCETSAALATYMFLDISSPYIPYDSFSDFQPLVSSPSNPNNGADVVKFAAVCSQDGGLTCLSSLTTYISSSCKGSYTTPQPTSQSNKCYNIQVSCEDASFLNTKINLCKSNPAWNPIK